METEQKDFMIIKSRKVSLWRVCLMTVVVLLIAFFFVNILMNRLDRSICQHNLVTFKNAVIIFEQVHHRYPTSYQELAWETGLLGSINEKQYKWVPATDGQPPILICTKYNLISIDVISNK